MFIMKVSYMQYDIILMNEILYSIPSELKDRD